MAVVRIASFLAASSRVETSRTIARPITREPQAPSDCSTRATSSTPMLWAGIASSSPAR